MATFSAPADAGEAGTSEAGKDEAGRGPAVWLDLDQEALDDAYDQSKYAPNIRQVLARHETDSALTRERLGPPQRLAYGASPIEAIDLYPTQAPNAPVNVFIHGGAWRTGLARTYGFPAEAFVRAGAHFAVPDFTNVTETGGDLMPMVEQIRRAIVWLHRNAGRFGGDPNRFYLTGHSSGAHLASVMAVTDWTAYGAPEDLFKGVALGSGMYDLRPVRLSARSKYVAFTDAMEDTLSAQRHVDRLRAPLVILYGSLETPEFQRQARDFAEAARAAGKPVELIIVPGYNHFEVLETLANPYGFFGRAVLRQMGLAPD